jgi:hypothetical protein
VDIELLAAERFFATGVKSRAPSTRFIVSSHDYTSTLSSEELAATLDRMWKVRSPSQCTCMARLLSHAPHSPPSLRLPVALRSVAVLRTVVGGVGGSGRGENCQHSDGYCRCGTHGRPTCHPARYARSPLTPLMVELALSEERWSSLRVALRCELPTPS